VLTSVLTSLACVLSPTCVAQAEPARSGAAFRDSVGVNTHIVYYDTPYADWGRIVGKLEELGVRHLRDGLYANPAPQWRSWNERYYRSVEFAGARGMKFTFGLGRPGDDFGSLTDKAAVLRDRLLPHAAAVESANEYDNVDGGRLNWPQELRAFQRELHDVTQADPALRDLPVVGPSFVRKGSRQAVGDLSGVLDQGNLHPYTGGNEPGPGHLRDEADLMRQVSGDKPLVATEVGFHTAVNVDDGGDAQPPVTEAVQATYTLRTYLEHFRAGIKRTFLYELIDEKPDPGRTDAERNFGLLRRDFSAKPAFTALRNLMTVVGDAAPVGATRPLGLAMGVDLTGVRSLLLQTGADRYKLVLWQGASIWDTEERRPLAVAPRRVTVKVPGILRAASVRPVATDRFAKLPVDATNTMTVPVGADPVVVDLQVPAAAAARKQRARLARLRASRRG